MRIPLFVEGEQLHQHAEQVMRELRRPGLRLCRSKETATGTIPPATAAGAREGIRGLRFPFMTVSAACGIRPAPHRFCT